MASFFISDSGEIFFNFHNTILRVRISEGKSLTWDKIDFQICIRDVEELSLRDAEKYMRLMYFGHVEKNTREKKGQNCICGLSMNIAVSGIEIWQE